ncbi:MAG: TldD/PmbA family protein [Armatimonadetes bacterium]|nr:TldD/PmbA family protein [Armatimonadota bacterium]
MKELTDRALDKVRRLGASYGDIRIVRRTNESLSTKNGKVEALESSTDEGFGIRVVADGAWGFASSLEITPEEIDRAAELAVRIAKASASIEHEPVKLAPAEPADGRFEWEIKKDPFEIPIEEKISLLLDADNIIRQTPEIKVSEASMQFWRTEQIFASTEGSYIEQVKTESGAGIEATAVSEGEVQKRSYPASFGGDFATAGYEFVEAWDLVGNAERVAKEAAQLLTAPQCPSDTRALILEGSMLALQVHESCGHPIELDRVFGTEASYAGTSFLTPEKLGNFKYGSDIVNIVADATIPGGLGSFFYDDEGVPAQCVDIIDEGVFVGYLTSRETAEKLGQRSSGAMRADGWNRIPLIRMTNINLMPGDWTLGEMIEDTKRGLYAGTVVSWSIDDMRLNFQFATEFAYDIEDGSLGKLFKNATYTGITYEFWGNCDAIAGEDEWHLWGIPNCGKGQPGQAAHVGHGVAPARFQNVRIGVVESQEESEE